MSMSGMGMSAMGMGTSLFQDENMRLARTYWYLVAGVTGLFLAVQAAELLQSRIRLRKSSSSVQLPTKPSGPMSQAWATATAVAREASYPQLYVPVRFLTWMTPPPMGRILVLLVYWAVVIYMATAGAIVKDVYFWERIGFRNAWVTVTQIPFLYLLASKSSVLGFLAGSSYERLNWLHRWVARTIFITATVHGWHFWSEYQRSGIVSYMIQMMPMLKYGLGAWAILLWANISSLSPLRHWNYEVFVAQHMLTWIFFLYVVHVHIPSYAQYNIWFAIGALSFDRFCRAVLFLWQNIKLRPVKSTCEGSQRIGLQAQIRPVGEDITVITIKDVHFSWRAGQHLYLWIPRICPTDHHPYTIASAHTPPDTCVYNNSIQLVVRKHKGFSRRLYNHAKKMQTAAEKATLTAFVTGPYGLPPRWDIYETLVLISASTGASFTLAILESVLLSREATKCTRRIDFLLTAKKGDEVDYYVQRLHAVMGRAADVGVELRVNVHVTRRPSTPTLVHRAAGAGADEKSAGSPTSCVSSSRPSLSSRGSFQPAEAAPLDVEKYAAPDMSRRDSFATVNSNVHQSWSRPNIEAFIREPVEATGGETSVVVCGGKSLVARTRNCVARLSDERAVHKGTGSQGIHLHVEEYCF